ncbi:hypothetical protein DL93DRAFT_2233814 [Clavulina sp. PMI_390]|nr:hypothetical protein DL93DRAFT_2233814 [Clavulina sp. PMI_390]
MPFGVAASLSFISGDHNDTQQRPNNDLERVPQAHTIESTTMAALLAPSCTTIATHVAPSGVAVLLCSFSINHIDAQRLTTPDHLKQANYAPATTSTTTNLAHCHPIHHNSTACNALRRYGVAVLLQRQQRRQRPQPCDRLKRAHDNPAALSTTVHHRLPAQLPLPQHCAPVTPQPPQRAHNASATSSTTIAPPVTSLSTTTATRATPSGVAALLCHLFFADRDAPIAHDPATTSNAPAASLTSTV